MILIDQLVTHYCGKTLAKDLTRTSDWERMLTSRQIECMKSIVWKEFYSDTM